MAHFASNARAITPVTRGAEALVPVNWSVQIALPNVEVVWGLVR